MDQRTFDGLREIGQVSVPVTDLERAIRFYRDKLGMKFLFQVPNMAFFDCLSLRLLLSLPEEDTFAPPGSILYFKVPDIHAYTDALRSRAVEFASEPHLIARMADHELWMAFFKDSEGNTLALMAEVR